MGNGTTLYIGTNSITNGITVTGMGNNEGLGALRIEGTATTNVTLMGNASLGGQSAGTLNGIISGGFGITKVGINTLTLLGANSYTGGTTINAGTLQVGNGGTTGSLGSGAITNNSNLVYLFGGTTAVATPQNYSGTGNLSLTGGMVWYPANLTVGGNLTINSTQNANWLGLQTNINPVITVGGTTSISGFLAGRDGGNNTLTFNSSGAVTLNNITNGVISNFWEWDTLNINAGSSAINVTGNSVMVQNTFDSTWNLTGLVNISGNISGSPLSGGTQTLNINTAGASTISGALSSTVALTKSGTGTLTVSGNNTNTRTTTVNAGTLNLSGSLNVGAGTATTVVAAGATLSGAGVITAATLNHSGGGTVNLTGNNMIGVIATSGSIGDFTLNNGQNLSVGAMTTTAGRTINLTANGGITTTGALAVGALGNISLNANDMAIGANLSGTGVLTLQPVSTSRIVRVNNGSGDFSLDTTEIGRFVNGWSQINIGRTNSTATDIWVGTSSWQDPVTFRTAGRAQIVNGATITTTDNAPISFNVAWLDARGTINATGAVSYNFLTPNTFGYVSYGSVVNSNNNPIIFTGTNAFANTFGATTLNAGTGSISIPMGINTTSTGTGVNAFTASGGSITLGGNMGTTVSLGAVSLTATNPIILPQIVANSLVVNGAASLNGNITTNNGAMTFNNPVTLLGNRVLNSGTGTITFNSTIDGASNLTLNGSTVAMNGAVGATTRLGALSVNAVNNLTLPVINAATLFAQNTAAGADIILNGNIDANGAGTAVTLVSADDFSNATNRTITTGGAGGRFLIYSDKAADNVNGGLTGFSRYNCTYGGSCPSFASETGNGFLYKTIGILTATPTTLTNFQYGSALNLVGYAYTLTGYLNAGDSASDVVTGSLTGTSSYTVTSNAGSVHNINYLSGTLASSLGYNFVYANNTTALTVTKRDITAVVGNKTRAYGDANPVWGLADVSFTNMANSEASSVMDTISFTPVTLTNTSNAGSSQVIGITSFNDDNYNLVSHSAGTLTVNKRDITAVVGNASRAYGAANPSLNHTNVTWNNLANLENGSVIDTLVLAAPSAVNTSNAGTNHTILISSFNDDNYNLIGQTTGVLTINKALLTATVQNVSKQYGDANPAFTVSYSGFANSENQSVIDTLATATSAASLTSNAGTLHAINVSGANDNNYDFTYVDGVLSINKRDITAVVGNKTRAYGDANPVWGLADVTFSNMANGEANSVIDMISFTPLTLTNTSNAGSTQVIGITGLNDDNYNLVGQTMGALTINKANLTVVALDARRRQGEPNMPFEYAVLGLKNNEDAALMVSNPILSTMANQLSPMGRYAITISGSSAQANYQIIGYVAGALTVIEPNYVPPTVERAVQDAVITNTPQSSNNVSVQSGGMESGGSDNKEIMVMNDADIENVKSGAQSQNNALIIVSQELLNQLNAIPNDFLGDMI